MIILKLYHFGICNPMWYMYLTYYWWMLTYSYCKIYKKIEYGWWIRIKRVLKIISVCSNIEVSWMVTRQIANMGVVKLSVSNHLSFTSFSGMYPFEKEILYRIGKRKK